MIDKTIIPKNTFDMKSVKDKIAELKRQHDDIVNTARNCVDGYNQFCEIQKELLRAKLPELVFGNCKHTNVEWDKNRYEGRESTGFWVCAECNEVVGKNYWIKKGGGWITKTEDKIIDEIVAAFLQEYPDINADICFDKI